jgi:hypothetical protein
MVGIDISLAVCNTLFNETGDSNIVPSHPETNGTGWVSGKKPTAVSMITAPNKLFSSHN